MLVNSVSHSMRSHGAGYTGSPQHRIESYTGRNNLALKPVAKKKQTGFINGLKSAFNKFGSWVKNLFTSKPSKKAAAKGFAAKFDRLNAKIEELNTEIQNVKQLDIKDRFDTIHGRLAALETQVGFHEALYDHDLPRAIPVPPPGYSHTPLATEYTAIPTAPLAPSSYTLSDTREDVSRASHIVSSVGIPHTQAIAGSMKDVAGVVDARSIVKDSARGRQESKLRDQIAADPSLASRMKKEAILPKEEREAIDTLKEAAKRTLEISRQVSDVADIVFDANRGLHLRQFQSRLDWLKADPNGPRTVDYTEIQADIKSLMSEIDTIRNWVVSYQEVLAEMMRLFTEFGPYLASEKDAVKFEIDTLMRKQQLYYNQLSHAELSLVGTGHEVASHS